ncbi:ABC transporter ATP-binding protein [Limobrevibacterium gyesilva]|uniref:ABC transporter ATP-binding protein n=1 Tax=Limobrevibacterium gyesilva TaxID=2991712 RepID=A0AA41YQT6_9PROT|nr:ABC transporter ATP-binding protein [Limobrevibacterium gyesilva]MCW3474805.1 ABC transporter ATP-binding protein [Limobrevibacterium gyesilva]
MIELQDLTCRFGDFTAVDAISLAVDEGAFCALIGPSGCGKSTTLRMINRLVERSAGTIRFAGEDIEHFRPEDLRRRMGYVIQSVGLFPHWTVERNIATVPALLGWPPARIRARVEELLALLRLDAARVRDQYPDQLSGGQQQRVGVARALAADPDVLLMDEPFGALDPVTRDALQDELLRIHRETRKTIVFVTHDMDEALKLATTIALMNRGRLVQVGTPLDILARPESDFVRDFVGREDHGLRLLAVQQVASRLRAGATVEGAPVQETMSLRSALSEMMTRGCDRLAVTDAGGRPVGGLFLEDMVRRPA